MDSCVKIDDLCWEIFHFQTLNFIEVGMQRPEWRARNKHNPPLCLFHELVLFCFTLFTLPFLFLLCDHFMVLLLWLQLSNYFSVPGLCWSCCCHNIKCAIAPVWFSSASPPFGGSEWNLVCCSIKSKSPLTILHMLQIRLCASVTKTN